MHQKLLKYLFASTKTAFTTTRLGQQLLRCCALVLLVLMSSELRAQEIYGCGNTAPPAIFPTTKLSNVTFSNNGITVRREVRGTPYFSGSSFSSACGHHGAGFLLMGRQHVQEVTYTFSQPLSSVIIWFYGLKNNAAIVSLDCVNGGLFTQEIGSANPQVQPSDCMNSAGVEGTGSRGMDANSRRIRGSGNTNLAVRFYVKDLNQSFTKLTVYEDNSGSNGAYGVELCPTSLVTALVVEQQPADKLSCGGAPVTFTAKPKHNFEHNLPNNLSTSYVWQYSSDGTNFSNIGNIAAIPKQSQTVFQSVSLTRSGADLKPGYYRVKFTLNQVSLPCSGGRKHTFESYSRAAKLTLGEAQDAEVVGSPIRIRQGQTTAVNFKITGQAGAEVTYNLTGGATGNGTVTLDNDGEATVSRNISQATTLKVTKVKKDGCENNNPNGRFTIGVLASSAPQECTTVPAPQFPTVAQYTAQATLNGVRVTRKLSGGYPRILNAPMVRRSYCEYTTGRMTPAGYPYLGEIDMSDKVTYTFSEPITRADVFFINFGSTPVHIRDQARITINGGKIPTLTKVYDCGDLTSISGNLVSSRVRRTVDTGIRVSSDEPFTEITVEVVKSKTEGFFVELCDVSIGVAGSLFSIAQHPANKSACSGAVVFESTVNKPATSRGTISYQWQENRGSGWQNVGARGTLPSNNKTTYTANSNQTTNGYKYRVVYTYNGANGVTTQETSNAATLTFNGVYINNVIANPSALSVGNNTVTFTIEGTPNAKVSYTLNGGSELQTTLDATGKGSVQHVLNGATTFRVTKGQLGSCTDTFTNIVKTLATTGCPTAPASPFAQTNNAQATIKGNKVTRAIAGTVAFSAAESNPGYCNNEAISAGYVHIGSGKASGVTYKFEKPITGVEVWLFKMGQAGGGTNADQAQFSAKCGNNNVNVTLTQQFNCNSEAYVDSSALQNDKRVVVNGKLTNLSVLVTADKPFTELTIADYLSNTTDGYYVALCDNSLQNVIIVGEQPESKTFCASESNHFEIRARGTLPAGYSNENVAYQLQYSTDNGTTWQNGANVVRRSGTYYAFDLTNEVIPANNGRLYRVKYTYVGTNMCGRNVDEYSGVATLTVEQLEVAPTLAAATYCPNVVASAIGLTVTGTGTLSYQWYSNTTNDTTNGTLISGATQRTYTPATTAVGTTYYYAVVRSTNLCGVATSTAVAITVQGAPQITTQPQSVVAAYCRGAQANALRVEARGNGTLHYQWYKNTTSNTTNGTAVGIDAATYTPSTAESVSYYYYVVVRDACGGTVTSTPVRIRVAAIAAPYVSSNLFVLCPEGVSSKEPFDLYVSKNAAGNTLRWYDTATSTVFTTTTPEIELLQTSTYTMTRYVSEINSLGCESDRVAVTLVVNQGDLPTIVAPANLVLPCNANVASVTEWLNSFTVSNTCGVASFTHTYVAPANPCTAGVITVTVQATDFFGNSTTVTRTVTFLSITAANDYNTTQITTAGAANVVDVLANDTVGGVSATVSNVALTQLQGATSIGGAPVPTLSISTGKISVPAGTAIGTYTISYQICTTLNGVTMCASATAYIVVGNLPLIVNPLTLEIEDNIVGGTTSSVITGVILSGVQSPSASSVTVQWRSTPPAGIHLNPDGTITVDPGVASGTYTFGYTVSETANPSNGGTATVTLVVKIPNLVVNDDSFTYTGTTNVGNILTNDRIGRRTPTAGTDVTISSTTVLTGNRPRLDPATGNIIVPNNTPQGTYQISYQECRVAAPGECYTGTVEVRVPHVAFPPIKAESDVFTYSGTTIMGNAVIGSDYYNYLLIDNTSFGQINVKQETVVTATNHPILRESDGMVIVPVGTPTNTYVLEYTICEGTGNCSTAYITVYVGTGPLEANPDTYTYTGTAEVGNIIDNDKVGNRRPIIGYDVQLTVTPTVSIIGAPTIDVATGKVTVHPNTPAGTYEYNYSICRGAECAANTVRVIVPASTATTVQAVDDEAVHTPGVSAPMVGNVLINDTVNDTDSATTANVNITPLSPQVPNKPYIRPSTGEIIVPVGTPTATYVLEYRICAGAGACDVATVTVYVGTATLVVNPDNFTYNNVGVIGNILDNDRLGNRKPRPNEVTITVTGTTVPGLPTLDPATGSVTVHPNTPAGTHLIEYTECYLAQCYSSTVLVTVPRVTNPAIEAVDDEMVWEGANEVGNVLDNDKYNGVAPVSPTQVNITQVVTPTGSVVPYINTANGKVIVPTGTPTETYVLKYRICASAGDCDEATVKVYVGTATLVVNPDTFTSTTPGTIGNILDNDRLGNRKPRPSEVTITVSGTTAPGLPRLDPSTGSVTVYPNTPQGTHLIEYTECYLTQCYSSTVSVTVPRVASPTIEAVDDEMNWRGTTEVGNVLANDKYNGTAPILASQVNITQVVTPTGSVVPYINTTNGKVIVPVGTPTSTYTLKYRICTGIGNCDEATVKVYVGTARLVVRPETFPYTNSTTLGNILTNDTIGNQSVTIADVTITATPSTDTGMPRIDTNTGEVTVANNTPQGTHLVEYTVCTTDGSQCGTASTTVVVSQSSTVVSVTSEEYTYAGVEEVGNVLDNDKVVDANGVRPAVVPQVNITQLNFPTEMPRPRIDPDGKVKVPAGTPTKTYYIGYRVCAGIGACGTGTVTIYVGTATLVVNPDTFTSSTTTGTIGNILDNDRIGNRKPRPDEVSITVSGTTAPGLPTIDSNTGSVTVYDNTPQGTHTVTYTECQVGNPSTCTTTTLTVEVPQDPNFNLEAVEDIYRVDEGSVATVVGNILSNDKRGGVSPVRASEVNITIVRTPTGSLLPTINATTGVVSVPSGIATGTYEFEYRICTGIGACSSAKAIVYVGNVLVINPDTFTYTGTPDIGNITDNDRMGNRTPTINTDITITVSPTTPGHPTLDKDTGKVTVHPNTPSGTYTINYQVCTKVGPRQCQSGTVTVIVPYLVAVNDNFTYDVNEVVGNILTNDTMNGNTRSVTTRDVSISVLAQPSGTVPVIETTTGNVKVGRGILHGTYTYTYQIATTSPVATATATVSVKVDWLNLQPDTFTRTTNTNTTPSILDNDTVSGTTQTATTNDVDIVPTNPSSDPDKPRLDPNNGKVIIPDNVAPGTHTLTYDVCPKGQRTGCKSGTITIVVPSDDLVAKAQDDAATTVWNTPVRIDVLANDKPKNLIPVVVTPPAHGRTEVNADNTVTYTPENYEGEDSFVYEITDTFGNKSRATVRVTIIRDLKPNNGITPDGDGNNDYFHIGGIEAFPNNVVRIFNRWGVIVSEINGYNNSTLRFEGESTARATVDASGKLPQGTYFYIIEYTDTAGNKNVKKGHLYLKR